jgi:hypothetical protein
MIVELKDVWFYTFSTSAQVLAALTGLYAVFVVYRMQDVTPRLNTIKRAVSNLLLEASAHAFEPIKKELYLESIYLYTLKSNLELKTMFEMLLKFDPVLIPRINAILYSSNEGESLRINKETLKKFEDQIKFRNELLRSLLITLITNLVTIFYCIMLLTFTADVFKQSYHCLPKILLIINLVLVASSLIYTGYSIYKTTAQE